MNHPSPRIVFMGTPEFAVASLRALLDHGLNVVGVVTAPDKPAGRGQKLSASAVKKFGLERGIKVLQPMKLKDPDFLQELSALNADIQVVVAFRMLPESVWKMPRLGTFNLHASLLPQYRGAAPINWCLINGERETGITTFLLDQQIDTGALLEQEKVSVGPDETAGELHDRLMSAGASLVVHTVESLAAGTARPRPQLSQEVTGSNLKDAPKLNKENTRIDWNQPCEKIHNLVRGLSPYPAAHTTLWNGDGSSPVDVKILRTRFMHQENPISRPGNIETDGKTFIRVQGADGLVELVDIQVAGKPRMPIRDLLNGFRFQPGAFFNGGEHA